MDAAVRQQLEYEISQTRKKLSVIHPRKRGGYPDEVSRRHRTRSQRTSAGTAAIGVQAQSRPHSGVSQASAVRSASRTQPHSRLRLVYWIAVCLCTVYGLCTGLRCACVPWQPLYCYSRVCCAIMKCQQ